MNQQEKRQFSAKLDKPLNLPDIDTLDTLATMASKLTVIHHSLSHGMPDIEDEVLQGLANLVEEVQSDLVPITKYCQQAEDILFPLWRSLQVLNTAGPVIFERLCEMDHDGLIQDSFIFQLIEIKKKRRKAAIEGEVTR